MMAAKRVTEWMGEHAAVVDNHANYIDRLAQFEDVGLEPDVILELLADAIAMDKKSKEYRRMNKESIMRAANAIIEALLFCDDVAFVDDVVQHVADGVTFYEDEIKNYDEI